MRRIGSIAVVLVLAPLAAGLAACGEKKLDTAKLERRLKAGIQQQQPGLRIRSVACPDDIEVRKGHKFTCQATSASGRKAAVRVTQSDEDANVTYQVGG
jgi:hypothetical protein